MYSGGEKAPADPVGDLTDTTDFEISEVRVAKSPAVVLECCVYIG